MTTDNKKLEGLGKLLKAAGVKPAGAEAMVRDHIQDIQADAHHHHAELIASVKAVKEELVELQHNHASSASEIRMTIELMRHEIEARSVASDRKTTFPFSRHTQPDWWHLHCGRDCGHYHDRQRV